MVIMITSFLYISLVFQARTDFRNCSRTIDREHMVDAFGTLKRPIAQELILSNILKNPLAKETMVQRALTTLIAMDHEPLLVSPN